MPRPSSVLMREHEVILRAVKGLENKINYMRDSGRIDVDFLRGFIEFSRTFIDRCHHGKEEVCLFPCLERRGIPREGGPIGVLLMEHEMGRTLIKRLSEALDRYVEHGEGFDRVIQLCEGYVELLKEHIDKENNVLFPMGDEVMEEKDSDEVESCYDEREEEIGHGIHERMERLAEHLGGESEDST